MSTFDKKWEEVHNSRAWGAYPSEEVIRFIARNYYSKERENVKVVDLGCGQGANTWYIAKEKFDTYAFDGSASAIKAAKSLLEKHSVNAELIVSDASNTPYEDNFFDAAIDGALIYANTTDGIKSILKEVYRILKPNGKIFSTGLFTKNTSGYATGEKIEENTYRNVTEGTLQNIGTIHFFEKKEIEEIWDLCGFKDIKIDLIERTDYNGKHKISYYIAEATKID